jgi:ferric-dicitrate binding protein FerR (iron transport regulator)
VSSSDRGRDQDQDQLGPRARVLVDLARDTAPAMSPLERTEGLRAVNARLEAHRRRGPRLIAVGVLGTAAAAAAVALLLRPAAPPPAQTAAAEAALEVRIEGGEIGSGGYVRPERPSGTVLRFSEGTELRLPAGARGRLSTVDAHGARFAIEEGEATVKVSPRPGARWLVDAGPFLITVRGTAFVAAWDGAR